MEQIWKEQGYDPPLTPGLNITRRLREELESKGLKGFKRGGKVKQTGVAKVHRGERIVSAAQAQKPAVKAALKQPAPSAPKAGAKETPPAWWTRLAKGQRIR